MLFTDEQVLILAELKIKREQIFDARGMKRYQFLDQAQGKVVFAPDDPCERGHVFWLSSGHCIQCRPQGLTHWRKFHEDGWIYIASSNYLRLHKIGATTNKNDRIRQLREGYGGAKDWTPTYWRKFQNYGRVEADAQASLRRYAVQRDYLHRGKKTKTKELINCPHEKVQAAIEAFAAEAINEVDEAGKILLRFP